MLDLSTALDATVRCLPHKIAIQTETSSVTYRDLGERIQLAVDHLLHLGISSGRLVALLFQNTPSCVITFLALAKLQTRVLVIGAETTPETVQALVSEERDLPVLGDRRSTASFGRPSVPLVAESFDVEVLLGPCLPLEEVMGGGRDQPFVYHYTSGSTGAPKTVIHSQYNLVKGGEIYRTTYQITADDTILVAVPLSHSFGLVAGLVTALLAGGSLLLIERFVPSQVMRMLQEEGVSVLIGTPLVYELLLGLNLPSSPELPAFRVALSSGSPVPGALAERFSRHFGISIFEVYGSTETGVIAAQWPRETDWPAQSVGQPLGGIQVRIVDEAARDVPQGATGQLIVRTPTMFLGYFNHREERPADLLDGWYQTGDLAWRNGDGDLYLVGRAPLLITLGEHTVNPLEVEIVLLSHPQVREVLVYANETLCAAVIAEGTIAPEQLLMFCRERLPSFKLPERIILVSELPRGELGKLRRIVSGLRVV